ncbi:MAG: InlB B-repeat-containing protein [Paludibacteraceae bacterium]|nr:InlB B-repeat-containing protein [Paludibacteraceae bacterium]
MKHLFKTTINCQLSTYTLSSPSEGGPRGSLSSPSEGGPMGSWGLRGLLRGFNGGRTGVAAAVKQHVTRGFCGSIAVVAAAVQPQCATRTSIGSTSVVAAAVKHWFKYLALLLTLLLSVNVWGESMIYTHDFTTTISSGDNTLSTITWTASNSSNVGNYESQYYKGVQIGTSSKTGAVTLTSKNNWGAQSGTSYYGYTKVKKVYVWMNAGAAGSITATVTIGGKSATSDGMTVTKNSSASSQRSGTTKVTFTPATDGETGKIVIAVSKGTANKSAGYLCAIQVECEQAATVTRTVTWKVNNETYTTGNPTTSVNDGAAVTTLPTAPTTDCGGKTFVGWTATANYTHATTAPGDLFSTAADAPTVSGGNVTYHAVFADASGSGGASGSVVVSYSSTNFPTEYGTGNTFTEYTLEGYKFQIQQVYKNGEKQQWRASGNTNGTGIIYNNEAFPGKIASVVVTWDNSDSNRNHTLKKGSSANPTEGTSVDGVYNSTEGTTTFDCGGDCDYFVLTNGTNAGYTKSFTINYGGGTTYSNYTTTCCTLWTAPTLTYTASANIGATLNPSWGTGTTHGTLTYSSSDDNILEVSSTGVVTTKAAGTAHIIASWTAADGYCENSTISNDITVIAAYNIFYKDQGGADFSGTHESGYPTTHTYGTATTLKSASKDYYTFDGWFTNSSCTGTAIQTVAADAYTADFTLYAKWTPVPYNINYTLNGGNNAVGNPATYTYETATITLQEPSKTGHSFQGWFKENTFVNQVTTIEQGSHGDIDLFANWLVNNYILTWDLNGGEITTAGTTAGDVAYGTSLVAPTVERTGYTFTGWKKNNVSVDFTQSVTMPAENATYVAQWTANKYDIIYKDENNADFSGTHGANHPTQHTYGTATTLVSPTKTGYNFIGWFTDAACTSSISTLGATDYLDAITLYAKWNEIMPTGITLSPDVTAIDLIYDGSASEKAKTITATVNPSTALNKTFTWSVVEGSDVVSVNGGVISALKAGTATVKVTSSRDANIYKEISVTVHSLPLIKWLNMDGSQFGETTKGTSAGKVGSLPSGTPTSCDAEKYPYFRGWSATNFGTTTDNPEANFVTVNTAVELDETYTFHAVCAAGESSISTVFTETFDQCEGTGGNDGSWSGSIASSTLTADNTGWTFDNEGGALNCAKFGSGSKKGSAQTPSITMSGDGTIILKAAAWDASSEGTTLNISATSGTVSPTSVTLKKGEWSEYEITITGVVSATKIKFEAANKNNNRFFIDNVVVKAGSIDYTEWATQCCTSWDAPTVTYNSPLQAGGAGVAPSITGTTHGTVSYESSNTAVLTVDADGTIHPQGAGTATITVTWTDDTYCDREVTSNTITVNGKISVAFDAKGGEGEMTNQSMPSNTATNLDKCTFTKTGYTFLGWDTDPAGETVVYEDEEEVTLSEGCTLYAVWQINTYTVTFTPSIDGQGSITVNGNSTGSVSVNYGETVTVGVTENTHYTLATLTANSNDIKDTKSFTMPDEAVEIAYSFAEAAYKTITFLNNGTQVGDSRKVYVGEAIGTLPTSDDVEPCDETSTTFMGWTSAELTEKTADEPALITATTTITSESSDTYNALWAKEEGGSSTVVFDLDGLDPSLTISNTSGSIVTQDEVTKGGLKLTLNTNKGSTNGDLYPTFYSKEGKDPEKVGPGTDNPYNDLRMYVNSTATLTFSSPVSALRVWATSKKANDESTASFSVGSPSSHTVTGLESTPFDLTMSTETTTVTITATSNQYRIQKIEATAGSTSYSDYITTCETKYDITLNQNSQGTISSVPTDKAVEGDIVTLTATPNDGYQFDGWTVLDGEAEEITVTDNTFTMPASNVEIEATFSCVTPTFKTDLSTETVTYTQSDEAYPLIVEANETWASYQWQSSTDQVEWTNIGTGAQYTPSTERIGTVYYRCLLKNVEGSCELTATSSPATVTVNQKQSNKYTITYAYKGWGTEAGSQVLEVDGNSEVTLPTLESLDMTKEGYTFSKWQMPDGTDKQPDETFIMPTENILISAVLEEIQQTVSCTVNGSAYDKLSWTTQPTTVDYWDEDLTADYTITPGYHVTEAAITVNGVALTAGEIEVNDEYESIVITPAAKKFGGAVSITLTVEPMQYTVYLSALDATNDYTKLVEATFGQEMPAIATLPVRPGYTFLGYYDAQTGGTQYYLSTGASAHIWDIPAGATLHAQWSTVSYGITYTETTNLTWGEKPATINIETDELTANYTVTNGYEVTGMTVTVGGNAIAADDIVYNQTHVDIMTTFSGAVVITPTVTPKNYTLTFHKNVTDDDQTTTQTFAYMETKNLTPNTFTRTGYLFTGWANNSTSQTKAYDDEGSYTYSYTTNKSLYAMWAENPAEWFDVTFIDQLQDNDVANPEQYQHLLTGSEITFPTLDDTADTPPDDTGQCNIAHYHFVGWVLSTELDQLGTTATIHEGGSQASVTANAMYYAIWATATIQ